MKTQIVFDCADPDRLARFWAEALHYKVQDPPHGFATWQAALKAWNVPEEEWNSASAIVDPGGHGRVLRERGEAGKSGARRPAGDRRRRSQKGSWARRRDGGQLRGAAARNPEWHANQHGVAQDPAGRLPATGLRPVCGCLGERDRGPPILR